jgi:hypothetical protein
MKHDSRGLRPTNALVLERNGLDEAFSAAFAV